MAKYSKRESCDCVRQDECVCVYVFSCVNGSGVKNVFVIVPSTSPCRQHCQLKGRFYVLRAGSVAMCGCTLLAAQLLPCLFPGD